MDDRDAPFEIIASGSALEGAEGSLALRLGACLNTIRSLQRWFMLLHESRGHTLLVERDKIQVYIAMCGCLKETLDVIGERAPHRRMILEWLALAPDKTKELSSKLTDLLDGRQRALTKHGSDTVYAELRRVRNKIDAHWDPDVFASYARKRAEAPSLRWASGPTSRQAELVVNASDEAMQLHLAAGLQGLDAQEYLSKRVRQCSEAMSLLGFALEYAIGTFLNTRGAVSQRLAKPTTQDHERAHRADSRKKSKAKRGKRK